MLFAPGSFIAKDCRAANCFSALVVKMVELYSKSSPSMQLQLRPANRKALVAAAHVQEFKRQPLQGLTADDVTESQPAPDSAAAGASAGSTAGRRRSGQRLQEAGINA